MRNSTIIPKKKVCARCLRESYIFSKNMCKQCSTIESTMKRMEQVNETIIKDEGLEDLIDKADAIFSRWLRLSQADEKGMVTCFILGKKIKWQEAQCAHYIKRRANLFLRYDLRNVTVQSKEANEYRGGMYKEYREKLNSLHPGITDILDTEGHLIYKPTRFELREIIAEYTRKFNQLKSSIK